MTTTPLVSDADLIAGGDHLRPPDEAHLAAAAILARYSGRTLEAYRHDLRSFFQWATDRDIEVGAATGAHIEMYRSRMEQRGLAASTIDRRLSTVCGYFSSTSTDGFRPTRLSTFAARRFHQPRVAHGPR